MKNAKTMMIVLALVGLAAGFGGGYFFRDYLLTRQRANFGAAGANGNFQRFAVGTRGGGNGAGRGGAVTGSVLSIDSNSMTVKLSDGSSRIVILSGSTTYSNTASANVSDVKTGANVAVFGTPNSDGSVTATNVQLNPMMTRPQGSPTPTP